MTLQAPYENPLAWDQITFAGQLWPGVVTVEGAERPYDWQKNKGKKSSGATVNYNGSDLAAPKFTFKLWKGYDVYGGWVDYFALWETYKAIFLKPVDPKNPTGIDVQHPTCEASEVHSVVTTKVGQVTPTGPGSATVTVETLEFRLPEKAGGTPKGSAANTPDSPSGESEVERAVRKEKEETQRLYDEASKP